ncbi:BON domain-containing protein [Paraburkholderia youngii]|uniref:BON domain-containing protein n=1 Tax=Paraburkholderia youngii TaxID=2782701 RepID=UPI003D1DE9EE
MQGKKLLVAAAGVLALAATANVFAQASDAGTAASSAKSARQANRALAREVRRALSRTKNLNVSNINVRANNGAVTLAGTVPEATMIDRAGEVAKGVAGVTSVKNTVSIRPPGQ